VYRIVPGAVNPKGRTASKPVLGRTDDASGSVFENFRCAGSDGGW